MTKQGLADSYAALLTCGLLTVYIASLYLILDLGLHLASSIFNHCATAVVFLLHFFVVYGSSLLSPCS